MRSFFERIYATVYNSSHYSWELIKKQNLKKISRKPPFTKKHRFLATDLMEISATPSFLTLIIMHTYREESELSVYQESNKKKKKKDEKGDTSKAFL